MTISDETLMAFADGELDGAMREAVESALLDDPELAHRVTLHRALRKRLQEAFGAELLEPVPERLIMAARAVTAPAAVANLQEVREATRARRPVRAAQWPWWQWGSMAASLVIGVGVGFLIWRGGSESLIRESQGLIVAEGDLAKALAERLGSDQDVTAPVHIGVTFIAKSGEYCRVFSTAGQIATVGLACRSGSDWQIQALLTPTPAPAQGGGYRTAGSGMPPQILQLIEARIAGEPLDAAGEAAARTKHWQAN